MSRSVSVVVPCLTEHRWQVDLTEAIIQVARHTTDVPFELIIAEAVGNYFDGRLPRQHLPPVDADKHFYNPAKGNANGDTNAGMALCSGDIIVVLTNDVFVKPGWLEAMLACFDLFPDCGMASLATTDHQGESQPVNAILEGIWCPIFAVLNRPEFRFDAVEFPSEWGDYDLVMRVYAAGFKAYRNRIVVCNHLGRMTNGNAMEPEKAAKIEGYRQKFLQRWGNTPVAASLMFRALISGWVI